MQENIFAPDKKTRILVIEQDTVSLGIIDAVCHDIGLKVHIAADSAIALRQMSERFFGMILCNPRLIHGPSENFIGNIRSKRGYEKIPVIILTEETNMEKVSVYLEEGADGYITKPFVKEVLYAHLSLFIRRQIYQLFNKDEYLRKGLDDGKGSVIFCCSSKKILDIQISSIETTVIPVITEDELFKELFSNNVWIVLIGTDAKWALPLVGKIKAEDSLNLQVIMLRSNNVLDAEVVDFFNNGGDDITSVKKPAFILSRQINSRLEREQYYKHKYISALRDAASKLPIRSERQMELKWPAWSFSALHHTHEQIPGGDFYEVISLENEQQMIILGDVMGKKWGAWFFSLAYLSYIRSTVRNLAVLNNLDPAGFLKELNGSVCRDFKLSEVFTTLTVIQTEENSSYLSIASSAGLPLLVKRKDGKVEKVKARGTLLGLDENAEYESLGLEMQPGDVLVMFTDGYTETADRNNLENMTEYLETTAGQVSAADIDEHLAKKVNHQFEDDRTVILLKRN